MTNETLDTLTDFLAWLAAFTLFIGLVHPWVLILTTLLAGATAVTTLFNE